MKNEKELIKRAQKGEAEAFGKLYDRHLTPIYRFIFLRVKGKPDAEDITQQVFLNAWKNIRKYRIRQGVPFSSWLYKIAKNAVIDYYRTERTHLDIELVSENILATSAAENEQKFDDALKVKLIKDALNKLAEDEQNVLIMKFIEEMSNKEMAEILEKSDGAIRVIQHRALKKLKKYLNEEQNS